MSKSEAVEHLKNSTVKIDNASRTGTGFFIADKLIATCYHNIKGHAKDELSVYWQGEAYVVKNIEINQEDDLALLEIQIDKKHPILQIDETVEVGDECQSFGYSRKNGDAITFKYEGKDGDSLLKFKEGLFQSGLSGGAILNFRTHKICGIVKSKRDNTESVALGGRAIPIAKLSNFERLDIDDNGSVFSKEMFKNYVWTSSVESADRLQFSILALVETLVAVGLSFFVWIYYGFYWHIITGLVIAPLFFLRIKESEQVSIITFLKYFRKINNNIKFLLISIFFTCSIIFFLFYSKLQTFLDILFVIISLALVKFELSLSLIVKFCITIKYFSIQSIKKIPYNWFKLIMSTDALYPFELISGMEKVRFNINKSRKGLKPIKISHVLEHNNFGSLKNKGFVDYFNLFMDFFGLLLPIFIFRYSLKSTAWIYLPFIWLIQPQNKNDLSTRLKIESKNFIAYLMFFYSLIVVFVFTLLPLIFPHTPLGVYLQTLAIPPTLKSIFFAYEFNLWHLTRFLSALITIVFMVSFTKILIRRETEPSYGDFWGAKLLSLRNVRSILTLVTLGFTAYHILGLLPDDFFVNLWENMKFK